jgi:hypothetical protein
MITITDETIAKLEAAGFNRWTKGRFDRLYINAESYGVEFDYYKSGNIRSCHAFGERVSNSEGYRFGSTKVYIDLTDGTLNIKTSTDYEDEIRAAVEAIIAEATAEPETETATGDEIEATESETESISDARTKMVEAIRAQGEAEATALRPRLVSQMGEGKADAMLAEYGDRITRVCDYIATAPAEWVIAHVGCSLAQLVTSVSDALAA